MITKIHFFLTFIWSIAASASLTIFAAIPLFHSLVGVFKLTEVTYLSRQTIVYNFDILMTYLLNPTIKTLRMPDFVSSPEGLKHFVDVKHLFILAILLALFFLLPTVIFIKKKLYIQFYQGIKICLVIPVFIAVIALFGGFDSVFISFHQIFFRDATWLFDPATDPVINILPETYFMLCFMIFGVIYLVFWSVLLLKTKRSFSNAKN
ncbi:TIGR01906 family membrane protein [Pseudolactococcus yaeyamensis]